MTTVRRIVAVGAAALTTALLVSACTTEAAPTGPVTVRVGTVAGELEYFAPFLYEEFTEGGLQVEIVAMDDPVFVTAAVASGTLDFGISRVGDAIASIAEGSGVTMLAAAADGGNALVAREGIDTLAQLVGARVGVQSGSTQDLILQLMLAEAQIDPLTLRDVLFPSGGLATAFQQGDVDAIIAGSADAALALQAGGHVVDDADSTAIGGAHLALITNTELVADDPELVTEIVRTHLETLEWMSSHESEWIAELAFAFGGDAGVLREQAELVSFIPLPSGFAGALTAHAELLLERGALSELPPIESLFDRTFIDEVRAAG